MARFRALRPIADHVAPFTQIAAAYETMAKGGHLGKIVLRVR